MELVDIDAESPTLISNVEVMQLLQKNIEGRAKSSSSKKANMKRNKHFRHRDWVEEEVHRYLQGTPCVKLDPKRREEFYSKLKSKKKMRNDKAAASKNSDADSSQDDQQSDEGQNATTSGFDLTEAEALQIMNMMPTEPVEIHLMVDELQSRMSDERQEKFLEFIASYTKTKASDSDKGTVPMDIEVDNDNKRDKQDSMNKNGESQTYVNGKPTAENGNQRSVNVKEEDAYLV